MLQVKTMEDNMKSFSEKIKECMALSETMNLLHSLVKVIECEVFTSNISSKH
jgi:hypothetical protein